MTDQYLKVTCCQNGNKSIEYSHSVHSFIALLYAFISTITAFCVICCEKPVTHGDKEAKERKTDKAHSLNITDAENMMQPSFVADLQYWLRRKINYEL